MGVIPWGSSPPSAPGRAAWKRGACEAREGGRHERGEGAPRFHAARRCAPRIETSSRAKRATASSDSWFCFCERGASPPFTLSPRSRRQRTSSLPLFFARSAKRHSLSKHADLRPVLPVGARTARRRRAGGKDPHPPPDDSPLGVDPSSAGGAQARERRPPVGTARRRRADGKDPAPPDDSPLGVDPSSAGGAAGTGTPTSGRHSPPQAGGGKDPHPPG